MQVTCLISRGVPYLGDCKGYAPSDREESWALERSQRTSGAKPAWPQNGAKMGGAVQNREGGLERTVSSPT